MISKLEALLNELEIVIPQHEMLKMEVSKASIGWQIEHSLLTIDGIIELMKKSKPTDYRWRFNVPRVLIFASGKIRRGIAQAPEAVTPKSNFNIETLQLHINQTKEKIKVLPTLNAKQYFAHRFFGMLNLKSSIQFLEIHTNHHLSIALDVMKFNKRSIKV
jgi:hypothetical protein